MFENSNDRQQIHNEINDMEATVNTILKMYACVNLASFRCGTSNKILKCRLFDGLPDAYSNAIKHKHIMYGLGDRNLRLFSIHDMELIHSFNMNNEYIIIYYFLRKRLIRLNFK